MTKLDHALALAREGFNVFPLEPNGKKPRYKQWQHFATRDEAKIRNWWTAHPESNIGVHCGNLLVIDVDVKAGKPGDASLDALQAMNGDLPPTLTVRTPTGGRHLYFAVDRPTRFGAEILGPGLDVRSGNSYVVGPGSTIDGKEYVRE